MNIIQTWKTRELPSHYVPFYENIIKYKSNWNYMFFDDSDIIAFMKTKMPEYYDFFKSIQFKIQQIDFFRYLAVYYYGGLYLDLDVFITENFDELLNYDCAFPMEINKISDPLLRNNNLTFLVGNYGFYAKPKHPFIKKIIDNIITPKLTINDIELGCKHNGDPSEQVFVYYTTGPILVSFTYATYENKRDIHILKSEPYQENAFGRFGSHRMYGSWKLTNTKETLS